MHLTDLVMIVLGLLAVGVLVAGIFRRFPIPYTVMLVLVGVIVKSLAHQVPIFAEAEEFSISPDLVLFIFLPILIFESATKLNGRQLMKDIIPVVTLAVPALFLSAFFVAAFLTFIFKVHFMTALIFGALISATDPVAVVALFKALGAPARLTILLEGESLLNDASAIVLFTLCLTLVTQHLTFDTQTVVHSLGEFVRVFVGGAIVGAIAGLILAIVARILKFELQELLIALLVLAYFSFVIAEHYLHVSGVMSVVAAGMMSAMFVLPRISVEDCETVNETWDFLALIANTLLFLLMGLTIDVGSLMDKGVMILFAFMAVLIARAFSVYGILPMLQKVFHLPKVSLPYQNIMWWGGLKGGLALAMVLSVPESVPGQPLLLDLTLGVVLLTLVINAPTIKPLMNWFKLADPTPSECVEIAHVQQVARHDSDRVLHEFKQAHILSTANYTQLEEYVQKAFYHGHSHESDEDENIHAMLGVLHHEGVVLKGIYEAGMIGQYNYLELADQLQRKREHVIDCGQFLDENPAERGKWFDRIEQKIIGYCREKDWASFLLSHYQNLRQSEFMTRICVHILMLMHAKEALEADVTITDHSRELCNQYLNKELECQTSALFNIREAFPDFYRRFIKNFAFRSALANAKEAAERAFRHGAIGAKSYHVVLDDVITALKKVPSLTAPIKGMTAKELIRLLPMCSGLSNEALEALAKRSKLIKFLPGDVVIKQGDKGDALYIIANGALEVRRVTEDDKDMLLAQLRSGEVVGEMGLLGDAVRMASIKAILPSTLLRITRDDVLEAAKSHPEVTQVLEALKRSRES